MYYKSISYNFKIENRVEYNTLLVEKLNNKTSIKWNT
jgi:hypothetical protein